MADRRIDPAHRRGCPRQAGGRPSRARRRHLHAAERDPAASAGRIYAGPNACTKAYPLHGDPRTAAGAPLRNDILACHLEPAGQATYSVTFTAAQRDRLAQVFPSGVCDWTEPGVGQASVASPWIDYGD